MKRKTVTTAELAARLGVSERTIRDLTAKGVLHRTGRNAYNPQASTAAYEKYSNAGNTTFNSPSKARYEKTRNDLLEIRLRITNGELIDHTQALNVYERLNHAVRPSILGFHAKFAPELFQQSPGEAGRIVKKAVEQIIKNLIDPDFRAEALKLQAKKKEKAGAL